MEALQMDFKSFFKGKKILITGNTGFKGSWLSQIMLNFGANVIGYALPPNTTPNVFTALKLDKTMKTYYNDIRDIKKLDEVLKHERPEIVFHLAAQPIVRKSYDDPLYTFETNIMGTANILHAIKSAGCVKSVVMITTDKVYENKEQIWSYRETDTLGGHDPYSASKACAELIIKCYTKSYFPIQEYGHDHNTLVGVTRSGNVIGGGDWAEDRIIPDMIRAIFERKEPVLIRNPSAIRPWQHVLEPLSGYILLAQRLYEGKTEFVGAWNFAPDDAGNITVGELVKKGLVILEKGTMVSGNETRNKKHEATLLRLDSTKSLLILGWPRLINVDERLKMTFDWYKTFYENKDIIKKTDEQITEFMNNFDKKVNKINGGD